MVPHQDRWKQAELDEDDDHKTVAAVYAYRASGWRQLVYTFFSFATLGVLNLMATWFPQLYVYCRYSRCTLARAEIVLVCTVERLYEIADVSDVDLGSFVPDDGGVSYQQHEHSNRRADALRVFTYNSRRFRYDATSDSYVRITFDTKVQVPFEQIHRELAGGTSPVEHQRMLLEHGANVIDVPAPAWYVLLFREVLHPFYLFQVFSVALWFGDEYYYYSVCILVLSVSSAIFNLRETMANLKKLRDMAKFLCPVRLLRPQSNDLVSCCSDMIAPGDLLVLSGSSHQHSFTLPCDVILMAGTCVVNEAMLTGESVPVLKTPLPRHASGEGVKFDPMLHTQHTLFSGTTILQARPPVFYTGSAGPEGADSTGSAPHVVDEELDAALGDEKPGRHHLSSAAASRLCTGVVFRTGFSTQKGRLVAAILHPRPQRLGFYRESFRFVGVLFLIAVLGLGYSVGMFVWFKAHWQDIVLRSLDVVTIAVPPALPIALSVGVAAALRRLNGRLQIFCTSPPSINVAGIIDMICFDKTGTLTEPHLDVGCVVASVNGKLLEPESDLRRLSAQPLLLQALAACHGITEVHGELIGDPLDLIMFRATHWVLDESTATRHQAQKLLDATLAPEAAATKVDAVVRPGPVACALSADPSAIAVVKRFEFSSSLRRMSVVARKLAVGSGNSTFCALVKGAPESLLPLMVPASVPEDFESVLQHYTQQGHRVIAFAAADLPLAFNPVTATQAQVERNLTFVGLLVLENMLKSDSPAAIQALNVADIRSVIITGDNALTAVNVAKHCGITPPHFDVFLVDFEGKAVDGEPTLTWRLVSDDARATPLRVPLDVSISCPLLEATTPITTPVFDEVGKVALISDASTTVMELLERPDTDFAVTGAAIAALELENPILFKLLLMRGAVFARMTPEQKAELVVALQSLDYNVGFCGDGANDCNALKAADVGLSLSDAEASIAAPFTSRIASIGAMVSLLREGRCALVTSFQCFKYMALYSLIQFAQVCWLYQFGYVLSDLQFLYIDLFILFPLVFFMCATGPDPKLSKSAPNHHLISVEVLTSVIGNALIVFAGIVLINVYMSFLPWYVPSPFKPDAKNFVSMDVTTTFLFGNFQYLGICLAFSTGKPFRRPFYTNLLFTVAFVLLTIVSTVITLVSSPDLDWLALDTRLPFDFRLMTVFAFGVPYAIIAYTFEHFIIGRLVARAVARRRLLSTLHQRLAAFLGLDPSHAARTRNAVSPAHDLAHGANAHNGGSKYHA